MATKQPP